MKICIVTVYNGMNSGSFWQAYALGETLKEMNNEVFFLDRKGEGTASLIYKIGKVIKTFLKEGMQAGINKAKSFICFSKAQKVFNVLSMNKMEEMDCFIIGSDTIWNLESEHFKKYYKIYWGIDLKSNNINIYAGSVANTPYSLIQQYTDIPMAVENLKNISVRDMNTYNILRKITKKNIELVCDPTLLLNKEYYQKLENVPIENNGSKYIFLYLFDKLSDMQIAELKKFAADNNLLIISGFNKVKYADKNVINTPYNFLNYMLYADYIITDTFHGNVFSVNLQKQFISIDRKKSKITDLLERLNLNNRLVSENDSFIYKMQTDIDYSAINDEINKFREKSVNFLNNIVRGKNDN